MYNGNRFALAHNTVSYLNYEREDSLTDEYKNKRDFIADRYHQHAIFLIPKLITSLSK